MPPYPPSYASIEAGGTTKNGSHENKDWLDVEATEKKGLVPPTPTSSTKEQDTYNLSFPFQLMSGTVWFSMFAWGIWIATFYSTAIFAYNYDNFNIVFPDLYAPSHGKAFWSMAIHLIGAAYMSIVGAFQLVKFVRKRHAKLHRWAGRLYIVASLLASVGGLGFIFLKGSYGGKPADQAFATYGFIFLLSGIMTYYYARRREYNWHKLWAWRLYSLSLAGWLYRVDYYYWMVFFGINERSWLHLENYQGAIDYWINWAFFVPNLIIVEIVFWRGEATPVSCSWAGKALDVLYSCGFLLSVVFTIHAFYQLWLPSIIGTYNYETAWIM